jgi:arylsulfatase A-like enzyme
VDLGRFAGKGRELVLETRGYEEIGEPGQAFWGAPGADGRAAGPARDPVPGRHAARGPHRRLRLQAQHHPELDAFAKDAIVFEAAVAQASWTKPSVASILTSQLPGQHRAVQLRDPLDPSRSRRGDASTAAASRPARRSPTP